jgi:hypothetical protein
MKYSIYFILLASLFSCNSSENKNITTYFGGQIINPKANYVLFLKDDKVLDTIYFNNKNKFSASFKGLNEGLYTFKHGLEFQYVYLEPGDSVLVRLNTWDFDESIVFSGKGGNKNEFLINLFLQNEKDEKAMNQFFNLNEQGFERKIDSLANERKIIYENFTKSNNFIVSKGFEKLTNTAIYFPLYQLKEIYPFYYRKAHKLNEYPKLSENFYAFRDDINLNKVDLLSFYPYQNYVVSYLYNLAYQTEEKENSKNDLTINMLNSIVENIDAEEIKNTLLKRVIVNDFMKSEVTCKIDNEKLAIFLDNCTNEEYITQVNNLVNDSKFVENNKPLSDFDIISYNNETTSILPVIKDKNAVIYFWSTEYMSSDYLVSRIQFLEKFYPEILFIGIQMQPAYLNISEDAQLKKLNIERQYKLTPNSYANSFLTSHYPRIITVKKDGIVQNGFTYLDSKKLGSELKKLQLN